ncbi:hypothetical protein BCR34DRAFT_675109 [Clohesyomyces aquaticus]|uniref:Heterokaryon incompatibility domain-containing protein n=1 Tax=Clohesyomyces aquaticus TaxID=1231657 RepID=A0A1Y1ZD72_9PLEO|nr:hypothetical protein BCR34DRAFT_675109 [Clohesyomyces aquaticus]
MKDPDVKSRNGYAKIQYCFGCCIDKTSSAELSEAINSMFHWYRASARCYAYLSDVDALPGSDDLPDITHSRWFTRGWTLQELLAPASVQFYSSDWTFLGSKLRLCHELSHITNIDVNVLTTGTFDHISIATRLSWARSRKTTRIEDRAYCLMGIVGVDMPLLYGESERSFIRLQKEILKTSEDYSIFAWGPFTQDLPWACSLMNPPNLP